MLVKSLVSVAQMNETAAAITSLHDADEDNLAADDDLVETKDNLGTNPDPPGNPGPPPNFNPLPSPQTVDQKAPGE